MKPLGRVPVHRAVIPVLDEAVAALRVGEKLCILEQLNEVTRAIISNCPPNAENRHNAGGVEGM